MSHAPAPNPVPKFGTIDNPGYELDRLVLADISDLVAEHAPPAYSEEN